MNTFIIFFVLNIPDEAALPPAQPPATLNIASSLSSLKIPFTWVVTLSLCVCQSWFISTITFASASWFSLTSIEPIHY